MWLFKPKEVEEIKPTLHPNHLQTDRANQAYEKIGVTIRAIPGDPITHEHINVLIDYVLRDV